MTQKEIDRVVDAASHPPVTLMKAESPNGFGTGFAVEKGPTFPIQRTVGHLTLDELLNALVKESGAAEGKALRDEIARRVK